MIKAVEIQTLIKEAANLNSRHTNAWLSVSNETVADVESARNEVRKNFVARASTALEANERNGIAIDAIWGEGEFYELHLRAKEVNAFIKG